MASSIEATSTEDMGFRPEVRRVDEMDMRLLDIDECEERADEGELERGVEMSELDVLNEEYDAIGTIACEDGGTGRRKGGHGDEERAREMGADDENAAGPRRAGSRGATGSGDGSCKRGARRGSAGNCPDRGTSEGEPWGCVC